MSPDRARNPGGSPPWSAGQLDSDDRPQSWTGQRLRLLSYNIQAGLSTAKYSHYLTRSWQHIVPVPSRMENLDGIAQLIPDYDIVALQEVDTGSLRSGFVNQAKYLAERGGFQCVMDQANRRIGVISQHSNAVLSRIRPTQVIEHKLPGLPGRGVLQTTFGSGADNLQVIVLHLALGRRSRMRQIAFLADTIREYCHVIVMGDLNCRSDSREMKMLLRSAQLCEPEPGLHTFPSWRPDRQLDHILVSPTIQVEKVSVLAHTFSDHLPISMQVLVPMSVAVMS
ncbi:MAG: EEP domain-containing protein [Candidatus Competibacteraceae bacterium]|nr:EEP domain-containing protein [Candidatus Competibacteraceae bacterium]